MQPQTNADYKKIFSELIKKQMIILGPDITKAKVKNVTGITVNDQGEVTDIAGDPQAILQNLINQFVELSGMIVKKTMESILSTSGMSGVAAVQAVPPIAPPQPVVAPSPQVSPVQNQPQQAPVVTGANPFSDAVAPSEGAKNVKGDPSSQMGKEEMDSINKALSELGSQMQSGNSSLDNSQTSVSQSNQ